MESWYKIKEQSAGVFRLKLLWLIYKIFGLRFLKICLVPIVFVIYLFAKSARCTSKEYKKILFNYAKDNNIKVKNFSSFSHILNYAFSLSDKMSAICDDKPKIKFEVEENKSWNSFKECLNNNKGVFLISSHLGNIESFCAFPKYNHINFNKTLHALMEINQSSIFHKFIEERTKNSFFKLYSSKDLNFETIMSLYEDVLNGDMLLMAGDRVSSNNENKIIIVNILDKICKFPLGTFKYAKKIDVPTFGIIVVSVGLNKYKVIFQKLNLHDDIKIIAQSFANFLEKNIIKYPKNWFNFYRYFD